MLKANEGLGFLWKKNERFLGRRCTQECGQASKISGYFLIPLPLHMILRNLLYLIIAVICFIGTTFSLLAAVMIINKDLDLAPEHDPKILSLLLLTIALVCSTLGLVLTRFVKMLIPNG